MYAEKDDVSGAYIPHSDPKRPSNCAFWRLRDTNQAFADYSTHTTRRSLEALLKGIYMYRTKRSILVLPYLHPSDYTHS